MYCTRCGVELDEKVHYCPACGHPTKRAEAASNPYTEPRLALDTEHKKIGGVCAGFARYLGVEVLLIRIVWLALALGAGVGFVAYLVAWILMPKDAPRAAAAIMRGRVGRRGAPRLRCEKRIVSAHLTRCTWPMPNRAKLMYS